MSDVKLFKDRFPGYSIKGLKYFRGMDGEGFNATILKDGRRICIAINEGSGGETCYEELLAIDEKMLLDLVQKEKEKAPDVEDEIGFNRHTSLNLDILLEDMFVAWEFEAKVRRTMKKKTVFVTPDCKEGEARTLNHPFDAKAKEHIVKKYPGAVILNEVLV